jgi:hypothetical protein
VFQIPDDTIAQLTPAFWRTTSERRNLNADL